MDEISFGERLKLLRDEKKLSQEDLAKFFNLSQSTIAYYETNTKQPSQNTLKKLSDFFDVSVDYLLGRSENRKEQQLNCDSNVLNLAKRITELSDENKQAIERMIRGLEIEERIKDENAAGK